MSRNRTLRCFARRIRSHIAKPHQGVRNILAGAEDVLAEVVTWGVDTTAADRSQERHSPSAAHAVIKIRSVWCARSARTGTGQAA
jgi:hypothetical protein